MFWLKYSAKKKVVHQSSKATPYKLVIVFYGKYTYNLFIINPLLYERKANFYINQYHILIMLLECTNNYKMCFFIWYNRINSDNWFTHYVRRLFFYLKTTVISYILFKYNQNNFKQQIVNLILITVVFILFYPK